MLRKDDNEWVKKCGHCDAESVNPRGRRKTTRKDVVLGVSNMKVKCKMLWCALSAYTRRPPPVMGTS